MSVTAKTPHQTINASTTSSHPTNPTDIVHIQTLNDILVPVSRHLLAKYSTFISDLPPFLTSNVADTGRTVIPLPAASSEGLKLVIRLLGERVSTSSVIGSSVLRSLDIRDLPHIENALLISDIYDIPVVTPLIVDFSPDDNRPLFLWAMRAMLGPIARLPLLVWQTLLPSVELLPTEAREALQRRAPEALSALDRDQRRWTRMIDTLRSELYTHARGPAGIDGYSLKCQGKGKWYYSPCLCIQARPDWAELRRWVAEPIVQRLAQSRGIVLLSDLEAAFKRGSGCSRCGDRLWGTFEPAIRKFQADCPEIFQRFDLVWCMGPPAGSGPFVSVWEE